MNGLTRNGTTELVSRDQILRSEWRQGKNYFPCLQAVAGRPGSSEVPRDPLTRWDVSSTPANGIFLTKKLKN